ncbi:uncharacterized protein LOC131160374 isoform X2 [Malania oleifera]|uniref:uncharacterized protein LOC131160374 isoform X2 n=1 Tax=Malania oleifera TaxID=397392 RepID=UPI0025AE44EA|nr:uncharacterized protein LOC131160374 isoform X2 [Malania oleifera]XP_057971986.1 uncharacterized protein LOC131160374 isoform X2 [Malania oleifera]
MVVASVLRGGVLVRSSCSLGGCPSLAPSLLSSRPPVSSFPSPFSGYEIKIAATARKNVLLFPFFCTQVDSASALTFSSSIAQAPPIPPTDQAKDGSNFSTTPSSSNDPLKDAVDMLDIRVGRILKAWKHAEAESLYVEEVDVGEPEPRIICSGLVNYIPLEHLQGKKVVVLANLKPRNMRGIKSCGMLLAASDASHENVELLVPPDSSVLGERIWFGTEEEKENQPDAATPNQIQKKKVWELVQPNLKTDGSCVATLGVHFMRTMAGVVVCKSLKNARIS